MELKPFLLRCIVDAFDFFNEQLGDKDADWLEKMLNIVLDAACTTHTSQKVKPRAAQMFTFSKTTEGKSLPI